MKKKIATVIDILINVDRFEHIQITKYGERNIEYETPEERQSLEDELTSETIEDGARSLQKIADTLGGKVVKPTQDIVSKIRKKLPTWLTEGKEPNIANLHEDKFKIGVAKNVAAEYEKKINSKEASSELQDLISSSVTETTPVTGSITGSITGSTKPVVPTTLVDGVEINDDDLFA